MLTRFRQSGTIRGIILWLTIAAMFSLMFRKGHSIKWFDLLIVIVGVFVLIDSDALRSTKTMLRYLRPVLVICVCLFGFIVLAQIVGTVSGASAPLSIEAFKGFARAAFNIYVMFLIASLVFFDKRILPYASVAVALAPFMVLRAWWDLAEGSFISGGRLMGFFEVPILFGAWMTVVFLVALSVGVSLRSPPKKIGIALYLALLANFILWAGSRATWLGLVLTLVAWVVFDLRFRTDRYPRVFALVVAVAIAFVIGFFTLPTDQLHMQVYIAERASNFASSIVTLQPSQIQSQIQSETLPTLAGFVFRHPWGFGFSGNPEVGKSLTDPLASASNNSFLEVARYGGWGALFAFILLLGVVGKAAWGAARPWRPGVIPLSDLEMGWLFACLSFIVVITFTDGFVWRHTWFMLGVVLGIVCAARARSAGGQAAVQAVAS